MVAFANTASGDDKFAYGADGQFAAPAVEDIFLVVVERGADSDRLVGGKNGMVGADSRFCRAVFVDNQSLESGAVELVKQRMWDALTADVEEAAIGYRLTEFRQFEHGGKAARGGVEGFDAVAPHQAG